MMIVTDFKTLLQLRVNVHEEKVEFLCAHIQFLYCPPSVLLLLASTRAQLYIRMLPRIFFQHMLKSSLASTIRGVVCLIGLQGRGRHRLTVERERAVVGCMLQGWQCMRVYNYLQQYLKCSSNSIGELCYHKDQIPQKIWNMCVAFSFANNGILALEFSFLHPIKTQSSDMMQ